VRYSAEHKAQTRERIVKAACRCLKERGFKGASVADIMQAAKLTHGGFYSHFSSKDELEAEAIREGLNLSLKYLKRWGDGARADQKPLHVIIDNYLSAAHRANVPTGCPLPALSADVSRGGRAAKSALTAKLREIHEALESFAATTRPQDGGMVAIGVLSGLVGGLLLARATDNKARANQIIAATAVFLRRAVGSSDANRRRGRNIQI
jgi:TetR/AcrR family transcriptional repressor of nem operon